MRRIMYFVLAMVLSSFFVLLAASSANAQATASATIQGTVMDKSQAAVSGAEVVITSKATGTTRTATSSDTGYYRFDLLSAGMYTLKISKAGFSTIVQTVELLVGETTTANATMVPGAISETVEVTSEAPIVDLAKTSVSQEITPSEVQELP